MEYPRIKIKPKSKVFIRETLLITVFITALMYFYYLITWWGMNPYLKTGLFEGYIDSGYAFLEIGLQGIVFGLLFGLINMLLDRTKLFKRSFGLIILVKTVLYAVAVAFSQFFVYVVYHIFGIFQIEQMQSVQSQIYPSFMISMTIYFVFVILLINFILQVNRKFGYGILPAMITGKYYRPRKERRIFMFLDMKDSTGTAQRLGHVKYSLLIQSCIHELSDLIPRYKAQVYQYVGDEVVLTWTTARGMKELNCINLFFAFNQRLFDRQDHYRKNFKACPEFKAGLAEGVITVTEVGDIKREIAYHGDVLHTAARLEKLCNRLESKVLITEDLLNIIPEMNGYDMNMLGHFRLKGKEDPEKVYSVNRI